MNFLSVNAQKMTKFKLRKSDKIKLRIICKPYAYLQSIIKTTVKFQKNQNETVGGVAHTRYPLSIHFHCQNDRKMTKFKLQTKVITRKCVYETLCPQLVSHFQDVKMSKK